MYYSMYCGTLEVTSTVRRSSDVHHLPQIFQKACNANHSQSCKGKVNEKYNFNCLLVIVNYDYCSVKF